MTLFISIIFILSSYVLIFNIPASHEYNNQGYHLSTISQVLTPRERFMYVFFGSLPSRIYYSYEKRCYVVRGQAGYYKNDLRRKKGKRYKVVPRWQYYMNKLSPMSLIKSGFEFLSIGKSLLFGGGFNNGDEEEDLESGGADPDADGVTDGGADGGANGGENGGANGGANAGNDNNKEPGLLSKGMDMGKSMLSPLLNLFGGSKDTNNENKDDSNDKKDDSNDKKDDNNDNKNENKNDKNDENKDNNKDDKEGDKPVDYTGMVTDVLKSDSTKDAIKTGISLFVPGGPAIVTALNAADKYKSASDKIDKVEDKIPKVK